MQSMFSSEFVNAQLPTAYTTPAYPIPLPPSFPPGQPSRPSAAPPSTQSDESFSPSASHLNESQSALYTSEGTGETTGQLPNEGLVSEVPYTEAHWERLAMAVRVYDETKIKNCNDEMDTLLVFAGLFSAVLTAFNVESYKTLLQDSGDTTSAALVRISSQLSSLSSNYPAGGTLEPAYTVPAFSPPRSAVRINILWFSSLVLSLVSAFLGMLIKQWLREYLTGEYTSSRERIRLRHYRYYEGLLNWRVFEIATLPSLLLQLSLILFFIGLGDFLRQLDPLVGWLVTSLVIIWLLLFAASTLAPILSIPCPYKFPFSKNVNGLARSLVLRLLKKDMHVHRGLTGDYERHIRRDKKIDITAIIHADESSSDDGFLEGTLAACLREAEGSDVVQFLRKMLEHRLERPIASLKAEVDFDRLTTRALSASVLIAADLLEIALRTHNQMYPWMQEALAYLFSVLNYCTTVNRAIGPAMRRGLDAQSRLLSGNTQFVQEYLVLMSTHRHSLPSNLQLSPEAASSIVIEAQRLLNEGAVDPLELCRVILLIVSVQRELGPMGSRFRGLLASLVDPLEHRLSLAPAGGSHSISTMFTIRTCFSISAELSMKMPDFVPFNLAALLGRYHQAPSSGL